MLCWEKFSYELKASFDEWLPLRLIGVITFLVLALAVLDYVCEHFLKLLICHDYSVLRKSDQGLLDVFHYHLVLNLLLIYNHKIFQSPLVYLYGHPDVIVQTKGGSNHIDEVCDLIF